MKVIYADKLIDALGLWGCYKHESPEACDTLMKYEVLQAIEDQYDDEESKCEELADYIEVSLDHSDMGDDEVWFSREKREEILRELKKLNEIKFIVNFEVGNRHEIGDKILAVIDGGGNE